MTTAKNAVLVRLYLGNCCLVGEEFTFGGGGWDKNLVGGMSQFSVAREGRLTPFPPVRKTLIP